MYFLPSRTLRSFPDPRSSLSLPIPPSLFLVFHLSLAVASEISFSLIPYQHSQSAFLFATASTSCCLNWRFASRRRRRCTLSRSSKPLVPEAPGKVSWKQQRVKQSLTHRRTCVCVSCGVPGSLGDSLFHVMFFSFPFTIGK